MLDHVDAARTLRAARRARAVSQRELAALAGVPRSTVARAESGQVAPSLGTLARLLGALGYRVVAADRRGQLLELDDDHDRLRDDAGRRFPAHLVWGKTRGYAHWSPGLYWWGWHRISWPGGVGVLPPTHTYHHRPRDHPPPAPSEWDDAP
jgi:transcriptional regulator with XRE-family HTH domain